MFICWRADPLDRPLFPQLREMLEKVAEKLPESFSRDDIIYINTSFPEEAPDRQMLPAELPLFHSSPSCSRQAAESSVVTADIHESLEDEEEGADDRYVVVIASDHSTRSPAADTPLLSGATWHQGNGNAADHHLTGAMPQDRSDASLLLWKLGPAWYLNASMLWEPGGVDSLTSLIAVYALHNQPTCHFSVLRESASCMFMHIVYKLRRFQTVKILPLLNIFALL